MVTQDQSAPAAGLGLPSFHPLGFLFLVWAVLIGAAVVQHSLGGPADARIWMLDVDVERSLYTWFSQLVLAGAAVLLLDTGNKMYRSDGLVGVEWMLLGGIFLLLSADEALSFHELLSAPLGSALGTSGFLTFAWVIPAAVMCLIGLLALVPFLRGLPTRSLAMMILAATLFLGGALGMELVGGKIYSDAAGDVTSPSYRLAAIVEEGLEGLGVLVFLYSILLYRRDRRIAPLLQRV